MVANTPSTEIKLLKDDNWKLIQQNTFTRWVNQHLKKQADIGGPQVENLETDFADGICLIKLAEVLSGQSLARYNKKPTMRTQKLDNVSLVLNFFQNKEGIKIVNIDSSHIVDRNLKLILGLVWTLILHYSLSHRHFNLDGENGAKQATEEKKETPKQRLLVWIQSKLPHHPVNNFTSNWNDGIALGALVDACLDGRFGEWRNWKPENGLENTQKAMRAAEQALGVETLITPEELTNPNVDEKSVMTYLAQFPRAKPQMLGHISADIDRHPLVGIPTKFTIEFDRPNFHPELRIVDPRGQQIRAEVSKDASGGNKYQIEFVPEFIGEHKINLLAKADHDPSAASAFIPIESTTMNAIPAPKTIGLEHPSNSIGHHRRFQIKNVLDHHQLDVRAIDSEGKEILLDSNSEREADSVTCCYTPRMPGEHQIDIRYNGRHVPGSPFALEVADSGGAEAIHPPHEPLIERIMSPTEAEIDNIPAIPLHKDVIIWGRGILPKGTGASEELAVHVDNCPESVKIGIVKDNLLIPNSTKPYAQPFGASHPRQSFAFIPRTSGKYEVTVMTASGNLLLGKSPYKVNVGPKNLSAIRAVGPGLEGGIVGEEAIFYVDTHGKANQLEFAIEGPSETQIYCTDNGDGTALVKYTPHDPGRYIIKIVELDTNTFIRDSPFVIWVDAANSQPFPRQNAPLKIPPLEHWEGQVGKLFGFALPKEIAAETVVVEVFDPNLNKIVVDGRIVSNGRHYSFLPEKKGKHLLSIVADKLAVEGWPMVLKINDPIDPDKILLTGPGLSPTIQTRQKTTFTVDARAISSKPKGVEVKIVNTKGNEELGVEMDNRADPLMYTVRYEPMNAGVYQVSIFVNDLQVFLVPVHALDREDEEEEGGENGKTDAHQQQEHHLHYTPELGENEGNERKLSAGARLADEISEPVAGLSTAILFNCRGQHNIDGLAVRVKSPNGRRVEHDQKLEQIGPEQFRFSFVPKESGLHIVEIRNERGDEIEGSPFKIPVALLGTQRAHMAYANGPGLAVGVVGQTNHFTVWNAKELGAGELTLSIDGPGNAEVNPIQNTNENKCLIEYIVQEPGLYTINVLFNDAPISGSPFKVFVKPATTESLSTTKMSTPSSNAPIGNIESNKAGDKFNSPIPNSNFDFDDSYQNGSRPLADQTPKLLSRHPELASHELPTFTPNQKQAFNGDAKLVELSGRGLDNFVPGNTAEFLVDTSRAGLNTLFVAVITSKGPTEELNVRHMGASEYLVTYMVPFNVQAQIHIKYGDSPVPGSPFCANPATAPHNNGNGKEHYFSI